MFAALSVANINTEAQGSATVAFLTSIGGTTNPEGTQTYADGTPVQITATVTDPGYVFSTFIILGPGSTTTTSSDNPTTLTVEGGETYAVQAIFTPLQAPPGGNLPIASEMANAAIVVILPSAGGTTTPVPGTYALANATQLNLSATADSGWTFSHWVISGVNVTQSHGGYPVNLEPTDNPYNVNHGYGSTFEYQAVFTETNAPSPSIPEYSVAVIVVVAVALLLSAIATIVYKRRK
jgi:hypothetical protein